MSIIIKGVNLPTDGQIELIIRPHGKVFSKTRGISAEAIQIPNPHGDIIDRNQVFTYSHRDAQNLEEVPVILEGEEW